MTVTALTAVRKGRIGLHLDGSYHCSLHPGAAASLSVGRELDEEQLRGIVRASGLLGAKAYALELLSRRSYSSGALYEKLAAREGEEAALAAVERMRELGYLNDEDYARRFAAECRRKGFSSQRTARELAGKGIGRELAQDILSQREEDPEQAVARIVKRKYMRAIYDEKGLRRTQNALLRLGYRHGDIRAALERLLEDESYYDEYE